MGGTHCTHVNNMTGESINIGYTLAGANNLTGTTIDLL